MQRGTSACISSAAFHTKATNHCTSYRGFKRETNNQGEMEEIPMRCCKWVIYSDHTDPEQF